ncbi:hypothetical protein [Colwellia sp. MB02u-14]|uniref:hypothetical protein n=1 Tax=Colwellia sp. MB02u-14 TaxID=2759815 RepID=UPI0015F60A4D|nr:hypothetical protein [Colwellia sp. MB02u-14]MBA6302364.1 hypothetical protein [Colwellia sp. MB02u-14]
MKLLVLVVIGLLSSNVFAGSWVTLKSEDYYLWPAVYSTDNVRLQLIDKSKLSDPSGCKSVASDSYFLQASLQTEIKNKIYSLILATKMAKQEIQMWVHGCEGDNPMVQAVRY